MPFLGQEVSKEHKNTQILYLRGDEGGHISPWLSCDAARAGVAVGAQDPLGDTIWPGSSSSGGFPAPRELGEQLSSCPVLGELLWLVPSVLKTGRVFMSSPLLWYVSR